MSPLPAAERIVTVIAHPDDESFGLGAIIAAYAAAGAQVSVLCFTHGEASTLSDEDLLTVRPRELGDAAKVLGVADVQLCDHPDGHLAEVPLDPLAELVRSRVRHEGADLLLGFDEGGITGHADHDHATRAALTAADAESVPVLAWALPEDVAAVLRAEFGDGFVGRRAEELDFSVTVDRARQRSAIAAHRSQSRDNPALWRRLELLGDHEYLRWLRRPGSLPTAS